MAPRALEGVRVVIDFVPVTIRCNDCGYQWEVEGPVFRCPECRDGDVTMLTGREIEITSLELAD